MIKSDSEDIFNITKDFYFRKILFFWTFYSSNDPENNASQFPPKIWNRF